MQEGPVGVVSAWEGHWRGRETVLSAGGLASTVAMFCTDTLCREAPVSVRLHQGHRTRECTDTHPPEKRETDTQRDRDAETGRHEERDRRGETDAGRGRDGFRSGGESRWPRECVVGSSGLRRGGLAGRRPVGKGCCCISSQNLEAALGGRLQETQAQCLITQLVILGPGSVFSRKSQSLLFKPFN